MEKAVETVGNEGRRSRETTDCRGLGEECGAVLRQVVSISFYI
jgi:hypothetical protein